MAARDLFDTQLWSNGPRPGEFHPVNGHSTAAPPADPRTHSMQPIVTGTSVLGIVFDGGVMIAADTLGSYGSLARFRDMSRLKAVGNTTVVGASGDLADFDAISRMLDDVIVENEEWADGFKLRPKAVHTFLTRVLYNRRSKMNPLWNTVVVAGMGDGDQGPFLGYVDKIGVAYTDSTIATGYGAYIALPILRQAQEANPNMSQAEARELLVRCLKVMYYRDARSWNKYQIAVATAQGVTISDPLQAETDWSIAPMVRGYE